MSQFKWCAGKFLWSVSTFYPRIWLDKDENPGPEQMISESRGRNLQNTKQSCTLPDGIFGLCWTVRSLRYWCRITINSADTIATTTAAVAAAATSTTSTVGQDSVVGIATRYGLDGPGIGSWTGRCFSHPSNPAVGPSSLLYDGHRVCFPGIKRIRDGVDHPPRLEPSLKEE
jgi:hypothetical protein